MEWVLLIDDDELVAGSLREHLVRGGLSVDVAIDCGRASLMMAQRDYSAVVIDPYFTGRVPQQDDGCLESIRTLQPETALIVLTAYASPRLTAAATRAGATLLAKPQSVVHLGSVVMNACNPTPVLRGTSE